MESVYGDEGGGFGGNDPGVEVGQLVRLQVAAQDLKERRGQRECVVHWGAYLFRRSGCPATSGEKFALPSRVSRWV